MAHSGSAEKGVRKALIAGILANFGVAVAKFVAYVFTGSAAMLAESIHSLADSTNQGLLFIGLRRASRPPDESHPFGYDKEGYFWTFVVALIIFLLGAVFAIYEGIEKIRHPHPLENPMWSYGALTVGMIFEAYALRIAWQEFKHFRAENKGSLWSALRNAKDMTLPTVLFEDAAALFGLLTAALGVTLAIVTGNSVFDGLASVVIGLVLLVVAWFLAIESHSLLVGEAASVKDRQQIRSLVEADPAVVGLVDLLTLQRGPKSIIVGLELKFLDDLTTDQVEEAIHRLEDQIRAANPAASHVFVEARALRRKGQSAPDHA